MRWSAAHGRGRYHVVTTYGMTETCGGCVYDGRPLDGVSVELADDGRIMIGGPMLFSGYRLRPDADRGEPGRTAGCALRTAAAGTRAAARCWAGWTTW